MSAGDPVGRRAFVVGAGAAMLAGGAVSPAEAGVVDGPLPDFHPALKAELDFPLAWGTSPVRDFRAWRRAARAKVEEHLLVDREDGTPYDAEYVRGPQGDGYTRELVTLSLTRHERVRAALLTPHGPGPFPAVLLLHDHGAKFDIGKEKLVRPWYDDARLASAQTWADKYFSGRFVGDELARRGYVVLCADALGWGDRGPIAYEQQQALASNFYNLGSSLAGLMAREDARAARFLAGLGRVREVAAVGFSMGAYRAWQTAALTDAVKATAAVCWMTGLKEMLLPGTIISLRPATTPCAGSPVTTCSTRGCPGSSTSPTWRASPPPGRCSSSTAGSTRCSPPTAYRSPTTSCAPSGTPATPRSGCT